ncbi:hypothetical protein [Humibacter sp. RRB41]|uniref:hypothetical protein n=1 Tax=Humibacter sp. RRB41 TaxID=2919946 RepID=UPI001FAA41EE|nr:hypothetical protein [Humibacter sp. RRB41]
MANPIYVDAAPDPKPGSRGYLRWYWTLGPGLAKWAASPHPWTALHTHLADKVPPQYLDQIVSAWYHDVFHHWPAEAKGKNPLGKG